MSSNHSQKALAPVQAAPGVLAHPTSDRRLAVEHWLLSTLPQERRARTRLQWREQGVAMLPLGTLFSAIRIPSDIVLAAACTTWNPAIVDPLLAEVLGGPVICDPRGHRYYALVPASVPRTWHEAADDWRVVDVDVLGHGTLFGVPPVDRNRFDPTTALSYWSVPMESTDVLCRPLPVARLISAGREAMSEREA